MASKSWRSTETFAQQVRSRVIIVFFEHKTRPVQLKSERRASRRAATACWGCPFWPVASPGAASNATSAAAPVHCVSIAAPLLPLRVRFHDGTATERRGHD